jgi:protein-S-isoprenylcysteine O-methyltransferase Ste14
MDVQQRDGAAVRLPPPLVYVGALVIGGLLQLLLPFPVAFPLALRIGLSLAAALLGLWMLAGAIGHFRRTGQDPKPWLSTPEVISTGVYQRTRNPMYVGMALVQASIGVAWANGWILAAIPVVLGVVYATAIRHEEAYLERKFGEQYLAYKQRVRRWL